MNKPELWREIKRKEVEQQRKKEIEISNENYNINIYKEKDENYEAMKNFQNQFTSNPTNKIPNQIKDFKKNVIKNKNINDLQNESSLEKFKNSKLSEEKVNLKKGPTENKADFAENIENKKTRALEKEEKIVQLIKNFDPISENNDKEEEKEIEEKIGNSQTKKKKFEKIKKKSTKICIIY